MLLLALLPAGALAQTFQGALEPGDEMDRSRGDTFGGQYYDEYTFEAQAGEAIVVRQEADELDTYLIVRGPEGLEEVSDDFDGLSISQVEFTAPATGTYTIWASAFAPDQGGPYTVQATGGQGVLLSESGVLGPSDPVRDVPEAGPYYDEYEIQAGQGAIVTVTMTADPDLDTFLQVRAPGGEQFANDDAGSINVSRVSFVAPASGTYRIWASSLVSGVTGPYEVSVLIGGTAQVDTQMGALAESDPMSIKGEFYDELEITGGGGQIAFELETEEFDPFLAIVSPSGERFYPEGNPMITNPDTYGAVIGFVPNEPGTWRVYVTSYSLGETGAWTLRTIRSE